jgi:tetratricopeptide (TPR) repeat protein
MLGNVQKARGYCQQSQVLHRELGNRRGEAAAWDSLGYAEHQLGRLADAIDCYESALALVREVGDRFAEADYLIRLGDAHDAAGSPALARQAWERALDIFDSLRHDYAGKARHRLLLLPSSGGSGHEAPRDGRPRPGPPVPGSSYETVP